MTHHSDRATIVAVVAEQVRRLRKERKMSAQQLSDACAALGVEMPRAALANLETGRRGSLDVGELLVLAHVLGVPPVFLLFPVGHAADSTPVPGRTMSTWDALAWFTGETPATEMPEPQSPQGALEAFRHHAIAVHAAQVSAQQAYERRRAATTNLDPSLREQLDRTAAGFERLAFDDGLALRDFRQRMRGQGLEPPTLPERLAFIDRDVPEKGVSA
jgi:hypothetical protein